MKTIQEITRGHYFVIPENQRGFSWGRRQVEDLLNDLSLAGTASHYMGPLIVSRTSTSDFQDDDLSTTAEFTLEDGQQRLVTMLMIANGIRKRLEEVDGHVSLQSEELKKVLFYPFQGPQLRIQNRNTELQQFFCHILTGAPARPARITPPMRAMMLASTFITSYFATEGKEELLRWKARITNQAKFIWVDLASEGVNRYLAFDAINSRGLPLSEFDKLKNFCILVAQTRSLPIEPEKHWYAAISHLEQFGVGSRSMEESFIADLYAAYHDDRVGRDCVHSNFVNRYRPLLTESRPDLEGDFQGFVTLWEPFAKSFGFISSSDRARYYGALCCKDAGAWLDRIDNMDLVGICRMLLAACHERMSTNEFNVAARACEIFTFRVFGVLRFRKDKHAKELTKLASEVLRLGKNHEHVLGQICGWMSELAPMTSVLETLANGEPKYNFDRAVRGWALCYYFLYEYELSESPAGVSPLPWASDKQLKINTIEHILPQQHRDNGWWQTQWPDETRAERFKHRLGNLVLTSGNGTLGRKSFPQKVEDPTGRYSYKHSNATNTEKLIPTFASNAWQETNILTREGSMLNFAAERWSIPCCHDNEDYQLPDTFNELPDELRLIRISHNNCIESATVDIEAEDIDGDD